MSLNFALEVIIAVCMVVCGGGGQQIPSAPRNLRDTSFDNDLRPGFSGHAQITLEWSPPENGTDALTGYMLLVASKPEDDTCGVPRFAQRDIDNVTSYVLRAESVGELPKFGVDRFPCAYDIILQSVPGGNFDYDSFSVPVRVFDPSTTYTCNKTVDTLTGLVGISIEFSYKNDPLTNISYNVSVLNEQSDGSLGLPVARFSYDSEASLTNESFWPKNNGDCFDNATSNLQVNTEGDRVQGLLNVSDLCPKETDDCFNAYRVVIILFNIDDSITCSESGRTEPPTPVDGIKIFNPSLTDVEQSLYQISMRVMWDPPLEPYGARDYEIHVDNETANVNNQSIFIPTVNGVTEYIVNEEITLQSRKQTIYLQIRSNSGFFVSNWSDPVVVEFSSESTNTLSDGEIAAIVVAVIIAVLAIGVVIVCVFLCRSFIHSCNTDCY